MVIFTKTQSYPHSLFSPYFVIVDLWRGTKMKHENPETKIIREQKQYIQILEEQLAACKGQIRIQELLGY